MTAYFNLGEIEPIRAKKLNAVEGRVVDLEAATGVTSFNTRTGAVTLTSGDVTGALAYAPLNPANNLSDLAAAATARTNLGLAAIAASGSGTDLGDASVALAKIASIADQSILGNNSGVAAAPLALTAAQVRTMLVLAAVATSGSAADLTGNLAVARLNSGTSASASTYWRGDGTWAAVSGDPWTYLALSAADYNNATATFADITDGTTTLTWTPPANTNWELEARILIWTTDTANLPRVGFNVAAGVSRGYGGVNLWQPRDTATTSVSANGAWSDAAGITDAQIAAGSVLTASVPYVCEVIATGRSGATPTAISLQMACETAAAATCYVKRGSFMKYRTFA